MARQEARPPIFSQPQGEGQHLNKLEQSFNFFATKWRLRDWTFCDFGGQKEAAAGIPACQTHLWRRSRQARMPVST